MVAATSCSLRSARITFGLTLFSWWGVLSALSGKPTVAHAEQFWGKPTDDTRRRERILNYVCGCDVQSDDQSVGWFLCSVAWWIILWKGVGRSREMNNQMWRYGLTANRCAATSGRCRGERLRCAATRRHTSRTGVFLISEDREKTGFILVKSTNKCCVFWCTVNWARARLKTALIASGAVGSSAIYAEGVRKCVPADVER